MILIADSGSSKCSWALCSPEGILIKDILTIGFNPYFTNTSSIKNALEQSDLNKYKNRVRCVFFYGAGCSLTENKQIIKESLTAFFKNSKITVNHDLDAACFAVYNGNPSINVILGTGSNSCFFDGEKIYKNTPSLGFILGDEASGNYFGKQILNLYFNNIMPDELKKKLESKFETDLVIINKNIYNNNRANVFLSKYFPFIIETKGHPLIQKLIKDGLDTFIKLHIRCYNNYNQVEINFIGSVSYFLSNEIEEALKRHNLKSGIILKNPIKRLVNFHFESSTKFK